MAKPNELFNKIVQVFEKAQTTSSCHVKSSAVLKQIFDSVEHEEFFTEFKKILHILLKKDCKTENLFVNKSLAFIAQFCGSFKPTVQEDVEFEHPFVLKVFYYLLENQNSGNDTLRIRSSQLTLKLLDIYSGVLMNSDLIDAIEKTMMEGLRDLKIVVRLHAVTVLSRLQAPEEDDPIVNEFRTLMANDPSPKVRQLYVEKILCTKDTMECILERARDVSASVRLATFTRLAKLKRYLKIYQRQLVLKCALLESHEPNRVFVENVLIPNWLEDYNGNLFDFMRGITFYDSESEISESCALCEFSLKALFKTRTLNDFISALELNEHCLIPLDKINFENVNFWRILIEYLRSNLTLEYDDELEQITPELVRFCGYITQFYKTASSEDFTFLQNQFIVRQMFTIMQGLDVADTAGRQCVNELVSNTLKDCALTNETVLCVVQNLERTITDNEARARFVMEIISDIIYPLREDDTERIQQLTVKIKDIRCEIASKKNELNQVISVEDYDKAAKLQSDIDALENSLVQLEAQVVEPELPEKTSDIQTIIKFLEIAVGLLSSTKITSLTPCLKTLLDTVILEYLPHTNDAIKTRALKAYALVCLIDKKSAENGIHMYAACLFAYHDDQECNVDHLIVCTSAVVDLLRVHGLNIIACKNEASNEDEKQLETFYGGTSLTNVLSALVDLMDDMNLDIRSTAARGLCAFVLDGKIKSPSLMSRLVLKWCNPCEDNYRLRHIIGAVLGKWPFLPDFDYNFENAFLLVLDGLVNAPEDSPLADVDEDNLIKFLLSLAQTGRDSVALQTSLAQSICAKINSKPKSDLVPLYSKVLLSLSILNDVCVVEELIKMCDQLRDCVVHKRSLSNIIKFNAKLVKMLEIVEDNKIGKSGSDEHTL